MSDVNDAPWDPIKSTERRTLASVPTVNDLAFGRTSDTCTAGPAESSGAASASCPFVGLSATTDAVAESENDTATAINNAETAINRLV